MTKENCLRLLDHYKHVMGDKSTDNLGRSYSTQARVNAKRAYEDMLENLDRRGVKPASAPAKK